MKSSNGVPVAMSSVANDDFSLEAMHSQLRSQGGFMSLDHFELARVVSEMLQSQWKANPYWYRLPEHQIPYLSAIDLGDIEVDDVSLPDGVMSVKFVDDVECLITDIGPAIMVQLFDESDVHLLTGFQKGSGLTLGQLIDRMAWQGSPDTRPVKSERKMAAMLKRIVNVLFLHRHKPEFFKPDVLAKDRANYDEAIRRGDASKQRTVEERARRRKGQGYVFDSGERWSIDLGYVGPAEPKHGHTETGAERTHCWIRRGHWRRVRYGAGRAYSRWQFFPPQICRADLSPKAIPQDGEIAKAQSKVQPTNAPPHLPPMVA